MKVKYKREIEKKISKYRLVFNEDNKYIVDVSDDIAKDLLNNDNFELVEKQKKTKKSVLKALKGGD